MDTIQICMLGDFSLKFGDATVRYAGSRSRKIWGLLAYLICHRDQAIPQRKLLDLFWGDEDSANPENALRITLHRARELLDQLRPGLGKTMIVHRREGYQWSGDVAVTLDCDRFEALCRSAADAPGRVDACLQAIDLYRGEFLGKLSSDVWVIPLATHYENQYLNLTLEAAALLREQGRFGEAAEICRRAIALEPYHEPLYQQLMEALGAMKAPAEAAAVYETLSRRLFDDFGIRPAEETRAIYRRTAHSPGERTLPMDEVLEHLQEPEAVPGAMECDYDHFKVICFAEARALERSGNATHIGLISVTAAGAHPMGREAHRKIMDQLGQQLRLNLRRGDVISRCSQSQYILMLPGANYENSCMVCRRCMAAFTRAHPHAAVTLHYMVQPLTPNVSVP